MRQRIADHQPGMHTGQEERSMKVDRSAREVITSWRKGAAAEVDSSGDRRLAMAGVLVVS
jgi:hypothetical protein